MTSYDIAVDIIRKQDVAIKALTAALEEILAIAEQYEDVIDGPISVRPNPYMRIADNARAAIQKAANG